MITKPPVGTTFIKEQGGGIIKNKSMGINIR